MCLPPACVPDRPPENVCKLVCLQICLKNRYCINARDLRCSSAHGKQQHEHEHWIASVTSVFLSSKEQFLINDLSGEAGRGSPKLLSWNCLRGLVAP